MLIPFIVTATGRAVVAPVAEPTVDKGQDAGSPWWDGEWVDPHELYKPQEVTELRPKVRKLRKRLRDSGEEDRALKGRIYALQRAADQLERQAQEAIAQAQVEQLLQRIADRYRALARQQAAIEQELIRHEARMAHRRRIMQDDEQFLMVLMETLDG